MEMPHVLSRKTSGRSIIAEVDGFRFFAIATVVFYHLNTHITRTLSSVEDPSVFSENWLYLILSRGSVGVDVFFAISGFILALPFARHHLFAEPAVSFKSYFLRRLTRLEPPYVVSLIFFLAVHLVIFGETIQSIFPNFLASLFYVHSLVYNEWSKINPVAWSLEVEVQFYLLAPLLSLVFKIPGKWIRRAVMITIILVSILHYNTNYDWIEYWHLRKSLLMYIHLFFVGFLVADIYLVDWKGKIDARNFLWDAAGVGAMASLLYFNQPFSISDDILFSGGLLVAFIAIFKGSALNWFYTRPWVVVIGGMCYTIYLLHYAGIAFLANLTFSFVPSHWNYPTIITLQSMLILPLILLGSAIYFVLIERPCMDKDWPAKLMARVTVFFHRP